MYEPSSVGSYSHASTVVSPDFKSSSFAEEILMVLSTKGDLKILPTDAKPEKTFGMILITAKAKIITIMIMPRMKSALVKMFLNTFVFSDIMRIIPRRIVSCQGNFDL